MDAVDNVDMPWVAFFENFSAISTGCTGLKNYFFARDKKSRGYGNAYPGNHLFYLIML